MTSKAIANKILFSLQCVTVPWIVRIFHKAEDFIHELPILDIPILDLKNSVAGDWKVFWCISLI